MNFCKIVQINPYRIAEGRWYKCTAKLADELSDCEFFEDSAVFRGACKWQQNDFYKLCNCERARIEARIEAKMEDI